MNARVRKVVRSVVRSVVCGVAVVCLAGCMTAAKPPSAAERLAFNVQTNYVPQVVTQTNVVSLIQTQTVVEVVTVTNVDHAVVTVPVTNYSTVISFLTNVVSATNQVASGYTMTPNQNATAAAGVAGTLSNLGMPGTGTPSVVDESGNPINTTTYPRILLDTPLPKWVSTLGVVWTKATIRAEVGFTRYADAAHNIVETKPRIRMIHKRVKLTNATTQTYVAVKEFTSGETAPAGVAESVYRSTNAVQHAGSITFVSEQLRSDVYIGCRLKLVGPTTTFQNILPQRIVERPHSGTMEVTFGPAAPACIDYLLELAKATRFRIRYRMPSMRATGGQPGSSENEVDTGSDAPTDDTAHSPGGNEFDAVTYQAS